MRWRYTVQRFVMILLILLALSVISQAQHTFECETGIRYENAISITLPDARVDFETVSEFPPGYFVSVIGLGESFPVLRQDNIEFPFCQPAIPFPYEGQFPSTGEILTDEQSAWLNTVESGELQFSFASEQSDTGAYLFMLEGGEITPEDGAGDVFSLTFDPATIASLDAYLLAVQDDYNPALSLLAADDTVLLDDAEQPIRCDDAGTETCYGESVTLSDAFITQQSAFEALTGTDTAASLAIPQTVLAEGSVTLRAENNATNGRYLLALHITQTAPEVIRPVARLAIEEGTAAGLRCDDTLYEEVIVMDVPYATAENPVKISVIGEDGFVPVLALVEDDNSGFCYNSIPNIFVNYELVLPDIDVLPSENAIQQTLERPTQLAISSAEVATGTVTIVLEGAVLEEDTPQHQYAFSVPPRTQLTQPETTAFMIATDNDLNPLLALLDEAGNILEADGLKFVCDNAGFTDNCPPSSSDLSSSLLMFDGTPLQAFNVDAMLALPYVENGQYTLQTRPADDSPTGSYLLILHIQMP